MSKKNSFEPNAKTKYEIADFKRKQLKQKYDNLDKRSRPQSTGNLFGFILLVLFIIVFAKYLRTGEIVPFTFKSLIEFMADAPNFDVSWSMIDLTIYADWGWANFIRDSLNTITDIWEVCVILLGMIWESLEFLFYFVKGLLFT